VVAIRRDLDRNTVHKMLRMWTKRPTRLTPEDFRDLRGDLLAAA